MARHGVGPDRTFQFVEDEYMKADECDVLLRDPSDFTLKRLIPRVFGKLGVFGRLTSAMSLLMGYFGMTALSFLPMPEFVRAFEALHEASMALLGHVEANAEYQEEMKEAGLPCSAGAITLAPFDLVSDASRGMRGALLDMHRRPQNLPRPIDYLTPNQIGGATAPTEARVTPVFLSRSAAVRTAS